MSPTQRLLAHLKALGYHAKFVEKWNAFAKIRQDLFGAGGMQLPISALASRPVAAGEGVKVTVSEMVK